MGGTTYTYDLNGNLSITKDSKLDETKYDYDDFDRLQKSTYADSSFKQFGYDKNSNLTNFTNPANQTTTYIYDELNRLTNSTNSTNYYYDLGSRLTSIQNPASSISYIYDNANRISSTTQTVNSLPFTVGYEYDPVGNRKKLTQPSGLALDYTFDELNRLASIKDLASSIETAHYSYDALSRRIRLFLGNNTFTNYEYDSLNRLTQLSNKACISNCSSLGGSSGGSGGSGGTAHPRPFLGPPVLSTPLAKTQPISDFDYTYDNVGNRLTMTTLQGTDTYGYDSVYQLNSVSGSQTHSYQYDAVGNRQLADGTTYTPNNLNQYTDVGGTTYTYDGNGNLTNDGTNTYTYDYENRLKTATTPTNNATYEYDGLGRRIKKDVNGAITYFIYDGDQIIEERDSSGALLANYVYGSGIDEVLKMTRGGNDYYYHYDGLGSVTNLTNSTNSTIESYSYDVYGQPTIKDGTGQTIPTSAIGNNRMFTGREWEAETGLYYYRNRTYSPKIGRFLQRDPVTWGPDDPRLLSFYAFDKEVTVLTMKNIGIDEARAQKIVRIINAYPKLINHIGLTNPQNLHSYLYCFNNSVNWTDPYGLFMGSDKELLDTVLIVAGLGLIAVGIYPIGSTVVVVVGGIIFVVGLVDSLVSLAKLPETGKGIATGILNYSGFNERMKDIEEVENEGNCPPK